MVKRGGGVLTLRERLLNEGLEKNMDSMVVEILIDVREAMGANITNTVCEGVSPYIQDLVPGSTVGLRILSNLCVHRRATSEFRIPVEKLAWKNASGLKVAHGILKAYNFAKDDIFRATTHNKGTFNGIDAVAVALGQDWRAIEAACQAYASINPITE